MTGLRYSPLFDGSYDWKEQQIALWVDASDDLPRVKGREGTTKIDDAMIGRRARRLEVAVADLEKGKAGIAGAYRFSGERFRTYNAGSAAGGRAAWERSAGAQIREEVRRRTASSPPPAIRGIRPCQTGIFGQYPPPFISLESSKGPQ